MRLRLQKLYIYIIPVDIDQFHRVCDIAISQAYITTLPEELFNLDLKFLWVNNTNLRVLSREIKKCKNMKSLDISNNKLAYLPKEIYELKKLTRIGLNNNNYIDTRIDFPVARRIDILMSHGFVN